MVLFLAVLLESHQPSVTKNIKNVVEACIKTVDKRVPVIAGTGFK